MKINCPNCRRTAMTQPEGVLSYFDPRFTCKFCSFVGKLFVKAVR